MRENQEIHDCLRKHNVFQWQVAEKYGVADSTFCRKMRRKLSAKERLRIISLIEEIALQANKNDESED